MKSFKVIDRKTGETVSAEFITDYAGAVFVLADCGVLFVAWLDEWHEYVMELVEDDDLEVVPDE